MSTCIYGLFDLLEQQHEGTASPEEEEAIRRAAPCGRPPTG